MNGMKKLIESLESKKANQETITLIQENLTQKNLELLSSLIKSGSSLNDFLKETPEKFQQILLSDVLPELLKQENLGQWVVKNLFNLMWSDFQNNPDIIFSEEIFFKKAFGINMEEVDSHNLLKMFRLSFNFCVRAFTFAHNLADEIIAAIESGNTLVKPVGKLIEWNKHKRRVLHLSCLMEIFVIPRVTESSLIEYLKQKYRTYRKEKELEEKGTNPIEFYFYLTGTSRNELKGIYSIEANPDQPFPTFARCYYKTIWEHSHHRYPLNTQGRKNIYELCGFSEQECNYWNEKYQVEHREKYGHKLLLNQTTKQQLDLRKFDEPQLEEFWNLISRAITIFANQRKTPLTKELRKVMWEIGDKEVVSQYKKALASRGADEEFRQKLIYLESKAINDLVRSYSEDQQDYFTEDNNVWVYYYERQNCIRSLTLDFTEIKSEQLRSEMKLVVYEDIQNQIYLKRAIRNSETVLAELKALEEKFEIRSFRDITENMLLMFYHDSQKERKCTPKTIQRYNNSFRFAFSVLIDYLPEYSDFINPCTNIRLFNTNAHSASTEAIPENVIESIYENLSELSTRDQLIFRLLSETGWRSSEIMNLRLQDFELLPNENQYVEVKSKVFKTAVKRSENGLSEFNTAFITKTLYYDILEYMNSTRKLRDTYGIKKIFFSIAKDEETNYNIDIFCQHLQKLITENNICGPDGSLWRYSSKQSRKTAAVKLITEGASLVQVQRQLGHITPEATERYYAWTSEERLKELNSRFHSEQFDLLLKDEHLSKYSEEERLLLYAEFLTPVREVEFGKCTRHPSEGVCDVLGLNSCATCPKLCTGKKYLSEWIELRNSSLKRIEEFEETYQNNKIPESEYQKFREYQMEKRLYAEYDAVIKEIENYE